MNFDHLAGRHALVTGGGTGIGVAIARALAGAGMEVTIGGRRAEPLDKAAGSTPGLHAAIMDVADAEGLGAAIAAAEAARGPFSVVVANAGIAEGAPFLQLTLEDWNRMLAVNLTGVFLTAQYTLPGMLGLGWGRIINVSSVAGLRGLKNAAAYTAAKHGVIGLTRVLSEETLGRGITVNALCPGYVDTAIVEKNTRAIMAQTGRPREEAARGMVHANRHRRLIEAEEVAESALWLCAAHSGSVNGQAIEIMGGQA